MLYLITNRNIVKYGNLYSVVQKAVEGGVDAIILREKDLSFEELMLASEKIKDIIADKNVRLIINGNIEVAKKIKAAGFHIGFKKFMEEKYKFDGLLGVSVHSLEEAVSAEKNGANYILAGHVYETDCKKGLKPRGVDFIKSIASSVNIPVIALGGIDEKNIKNVIAAGAHGAAVMSYIMAAEDPYMAAKLLKNRLCLK
ncbi:thiamine phosphate synthase [Clostridium sp. ZS2-4]|uniref:thiamine phosphate synthase n=1 Tax=Clostridium sp. ZS2-4 TaxID=2987703 RepID=UPI00227B4FF0|nr:thiamine phosphate synthase [Clostridium sp. ZS2-4]MCY6356856.1 thiamine phosphate synthase [Clostridium sp. ZS2-4]